MHRATRFLSLFLIFFTTGCATLFAQKEDTITIKTEPPEAEVYLGTELLGTTPLVRTFERSTFEHKNLSIRKEGYKTREMLLSKTLEPVALLNIAFIITYGATSWGTDATSGAMLKYDPTSYYIDLEPVDAPPEPAALERRERIKFVLFNQHRLKSDIAQGDGEYLSAYHAITRTPEPYPLFLRRVREEAPGLLSQQDAVDLYARMEDIQLGLKIRIVSFKKGKKPWPTKLSGVIFR